MLLPVLATSAPSCSSATITSWPLALALALALPTTTAASSASAWCFLRSYICVPTKSKTSVPSAASMATNPGNGKRRHGAAGRQGSVSASSASCSMWTKPVARITPAANAFTSTNAPPVEEEEEEAPCPWQRRPTSGIATPVAPATSMVTTNTILSLSAAASSRHSTSSAPLDGSQLAVETDAATTTTERAERYVHATHVASKSHNDHERNRFVDLLTCHLLQVRADVRRFHHLLRFIPTQQPNSQNKNKKSCDSASQFSGIIGGKTNDHGGINTTQVWKGKE
jgi:hypothetical protein